MRSAELVANHPVSLKNSEAWRKEHVASVAYMKYPSSLLLRCWHRGTCLSKKPFQPACRLHNDRQRPNVEKHPVLDVACFPIGLDCHNVRQDTVCVRYRHRPLDDHLIDSDREDHTEHATPSAMCQSKQGPVFVHFDFAGLFGIVGRCDSTIISQARVRVAA